MSDMFESLDVNMREEAERVNPTKAIMASQLECEKRFESFVTRNPERVDFLSDDIRLVADKYAAEYDIPSETIYEATVTHLKEAAVKKAENMGGYPETINVDGIPVDVTIWDNETVTIELDGSSEPIGELNQDPRGRGFYAQPEMGQGQRFNNQEAALEFLIKNSYQFSDILESQEFGLDSDIRESSNKKAEWDKPWTKEYRTKQEEDKDRNIKSEESEEYEKSESYYKNRLPLQTEEEKEHEDEEEERKESSVRESKDCNCWEGYKRVPGTKPCSPGSCEKCDTDREKKKAAFILENAEDLVPEWIQKNAGWREMLRGFMNRNQLFDPMGAADWSSKKNPLPARARRMQKDLEAQEQPTVELLAPSGVSEYEDMIEDQSRAEEKMKENARKRQEMFETEPEYKTRGKHRYEYLRGASVQALEDFYVAQGMPEKTASILVEAVGELAQLQQNEPGLPVSATDPDNVNIDKEIGGSEEDKYRNIDVEETSKAIGIDSQEFTDFGDPVREFVQPGGEAPYSDNDERTENNKDKYKGKADRSKMDGKGVKQEDNAPKKSSTFDEPAMKVNGKIGDFYHASTGDGMKAMVLEIRSGYLPRKIKDFHGETAHTDAERFASDLALEQQRNKKDPVFGSDSKKSSASVKEAISPKNLGYEEDGIQSYESSRKETSKNKKSRKTQKENYDDRIEIKKNTAGTKAQVILDGEIQETFRGDDSLQQAKDYAHRLYLKNFAKEIKDMVDYPNSYRVHGSSNSVNLVPPEGVRSAARRGIKYHSEGKAGDGFESATLTRAHKIAEGQELTPEHVKRMHSFFERHAGGRSQKAKQGEITPWDVAWLAWGGDAGRTWAASKVKQMENAKKKSTPLNFDMIDGEVEKLMSEGMTPEQAVQSLGVYNETNEPEGWGGSKASSTKKSNGLSPGLWNDEDDVMETLVHDEDGVHKIEIHNHGNFSSVKMLVGDGKKDIGEIMEGPDGWMADNGSNYKNFTNEHDAIKYLINNYSEPEEVGPPPFSGGEFL